MKGKYRRLLKHLQLPDRQIVDILMRNKNWVNVVVDNLTYWVCTKYFYVAADGTGVATVRSLGFTPEETVAILRGLADQEQVEAKMALYALSGDVTTSAAGVDWDMVDVFLKDKHALLDCIALPDEKPFWRQQVWWKHCLSPAEKLALLYHYAGLRPISDFPVEQIDKVGTLTIKEIVKWLHKVGDA